MSSPLQPPAQPHAGHRHRPSSLGPTLSLLRLSAAVRLVGVAGLVGLLWWAVLGATG